MNVVVIHRESTFERVSRLVGLFLFAPLLLLLSMPVALHIVQNPDYGYTAYQLKVREVSEGGAAQLAGLQPGDTILAVNRNQVDSNPEYFAATAGNFNLDPLELTVARGGSNLMVVINPRSPSQAVMIKSYSLWVAGLAFLMIGWWVLLQRTDAVARNFFGLCFGFAFFLLDIPDINSVAFMEAKEYLRNFLQLMLPAFFLGFFLLFPSRRSRGKSRDARRRFLLAPGLVLFLTGAGVEIFGPGPGGNAETLIQAVALAYAMSYFVTALIIFARKVLRRDRPIQQTKMKVILLGLVGGLAPFFAAMLAGNLNPESSLPHLQYLGLFLLLVPASFGLAIMRYGALDTAFVVRVSLIYGLVSLFLLLTYLLIVLTLGSLLSDLFQVSALPLLLVLMAASSLAVMPLRRGVQGWIDSTFYPARRANRQAMAHLADRLTGMIDSDEVVLTLTTSLESLFQPAVFALFLVPSEDPNRFQTRTPYPQNDQHDPPASPPPPLTIPRNSGLGILLDRLRRPVFSEEIEDLLFAGETDSASLELITRLKAALLVPLVSGNQLLGFMAFGPKTSGDLYSQEDLANLRSMAIQAAAQVESRQLYHESLAGRKLETELQVARDIQARLLPTGPLDIGTAVISGFNEPCRMVGGDYFDYFQLPNETLGFAIADVSGKGIPAALMMTSFRVAFRQEARVGIRPQEVVGNLNPIVSRFVSGGSFVSFFFGIFDPAQGLLTYCNAGMDPPVLFRPRDSYRRILKKGGPVLGIDGDRSYREGTLALEPGDRIFLYTDGLTETINPHGEFFDSERLFDLVQANMDASPSRLLATIFSTVNAFGGDERMDDKTAILLEIKRLN